MNYKVILIGLMFWIAENMYFGWNALPQSDAEIVADMVVIVLFALAWAL